MSRNYIFIIIGNLQALNTRLKQDLVFVLYLFAKAASRFKMTVSDELLQASDSNLCPCVGQLLQQQRAVLLEFPGQHSGECFYDPLVWTVVIVIAGMELQKHVFHLQKVLVEDLAWEAKAVAKAPKVFVGHPG